MIRAGSSACWAIVNRLRGFLLLQVVERLHLSLPGSAQVWAECLKQKPNLKVLKVTSKRRRIFIYFTFLLCQTINRWTPPLSYLLNSVFLLHSQVLWDYFAKRFAYWFAVLPWVLKQWALNMLPHPLEEKKGGRGAEKIWDGLPFLPQGLRFSCMPSGSVCSSSSGLRVECQWGCICLSLFNSFTMKSLCADRVNLLCCFTSNLCKLVNLFLLHVLGADPAFWEHGILLKFACCF